MARWERYTGMVKKRPNALASSNPLPSDSSSVSQEELFLTSLADGSVRVTAELAVWVLPNVTLLSLPAQMSGGLQQWAAIMRTVTVDPKIILFDGLRHDRCCRSVNQLQVFEATISCNDACDTEQLSDRIERFGMRQTIEKRARRGGQYPDNDVDPIAGTDELSRIPALHTATDLTWH